jgi:hypothetical protein
MKKKRKAKKEKEARKAGNPKPQEEECERG